MHRIGVILRKGIPVVKALIADVIAVIVRFNDLDSYRLFNF